MYSSFQGKVVRGRIPRRVPSCSLFKGTHQEQKSFFHTLVSPKNLERLVIIVVLLVVPVYVALSFERNGGGAPTLLLEETAISSTVHTPFTTLRGTVSPSSQLYINNSPVVLRSNGGFEEKLALQQGINTIDIVARRYGLTTKTQRTIIYNP